MAEPTPGQAHTIRHSLGITRAAKPYRNHYCIVLPGLEMEAYMDAMVAAGWMRRGIEEQYMRTYHVTEAGAAAVGAALPTG